MKATQEHDADTSNTLFCIKAVTGEVVAVSV